MESLDLQARQVSEAIEQLGPQVDKLRHELVHVQDFLEGELNEALQQSASSVQGGLEDASNLRQLLAVLLKTVIDGNSLVAFSHEQSLQHVASKVNHELTVFMTAMATAAGSSTSLQDDIVSTITTFGCSMG